MKRPSRAKLCAAVAVSAAALCVSSVLAQPAPKQWWVEKTVGGVYVAPMRPLWRLSELKKMHAGQASWRQQIVKDPEQDATYNAGAPGTKVEPRMHPDTGTEFVVVAGQVRFDVEGQTPVTAVRGSIVHILRSTVFSYSVVGPEQALWVEVNPINYKTLYPASNPAPKPMHGGHAVKLAFDVVPPAYAGVNQLHWNLFDAIAKCEPAGIKVLDDHLFSNPLVAYRNPSDNKCGTGAGNAGNPPVAGQPTPTFDPKSTFGHLHAGPAEWWIVQVGQIRGQFENHGEFVGQEGDVLYAPPSMWHQMAAMAPTGPSVRLSMAGYALINMNSVPGQ